MRASFRELHQALSIPAERVLAIRERVLPLIRSRSTITRAGRSGIAVWKTGTFRFELRLATADWPPPQFTPPYSEALAEKTAPTVLPYSLDVWHGEKVGGGQDSRVEPRSLVAYLGPMVTIGVQKQSDPLRRPETEADRLSRIEAEEAVIAKAEADIDAGLGIDDDDLEQWLEALNSDENTPLPVSRSGPTFS